LLAASAAGSPVAAAPVQPYEVVRAADAGLSCEQLAGEINSLNAKVQSLQQDQAKRESRNRTTKGMLGRIAGVALQSAPSVLGNKFGADYATQYAVSGAVQNLRNGVPISGAPAEPATTATPPEQQRLNYVTGLFRDHNC
jgi:hypothetical protein